MEAAQKAARTVATPTGVIPSWAALAFTQQSPLLTLAARSHRYRSNVWVDERTLNGVPLRRESERPVRAYVTRRSTIVNAGMVASQDPEIARLGATAVPHLYMSASIKRAIRGRAGQELHRRSVSQRLGSHWWLERSKLWSRGIELKDERLAYAGGGVVDITTSRTGRWFNAEQLQDPTLLTSVPIDGSTCRRLGGAYETLLREVAGETPLVFNRDVINAFDLALAPGAQPLTVCDRHCGLCSLDDLTAGPELLAALGRDDSAPCPVDLITGHPLRLDALPDPADVDADAATDHAAAMAVTSPYWVDARRVGTTVAGVALELKEGAPRVRCQTPDVLRPVELFGVDALQDPGLGYRRAGGPTPRCIDFAGYPE